MISIPVPKNFASRMRAIATDMDGTFFGARLCVAESTMQAYRRAIREGVPVIPTTGRAHYGVECALRAANAFPEVTLYPGVFMNGCVAFGPRPSTLGKCKLLKGSEMSPHCGSETTASTGRMSTTLSFGNFGDELKFADGGNVSLEDFGSCLAPPLLCEHRIDRDTLAKVVDFVKAANQQEMAKPGWEERVGGSAPEHGFDAVTDSSLPPAFYSLMAYSRDCIVSEVEDQLTHGLQQFRDGETRYVGSLIDYAFPLSKGAPLQQEPPLQEAGVTRTFFKKDSDLSSESTADLFASVNDENAYGVTDKPIYKLLLLSHSGSFVNSLRPQLEALVGDRVDLVSAVPRILELNPKGCSKAEGLKHILNYLKISPQQVAALGDGENDMQLLATCGFAIAMANATPALIEMADVTTADNNSEGWALAVNALLDARAAALREEEDQYASDTD